MKRALATGILAATVLLTACEDSPPPPVQTLETQPVVSHVATAPTRVNPTLTKLPNQLMRAHGQGPVTPAIIILPETMSQPLIRVKLTAEEDEPPVLSERYPGRVDTIRLPNGKYIKVNTLPMETYLRGVLAHELIASWEPAAFQAQAVAARTYALYQMETFGRDKPYDVNNNTSSQMYGPVAAKKYRTAIEAVTATRGEVLTATLSGQTGIFCSRFSACSGGATQDPSDAWGDLTLPELAGHNVGAFDSNCAKYRWPPMTLAKSDILRSIRNWGQENNVPYMAAFGPIKTVTISKRNPVTHRPTEFTLTDTAGNTAPMRAEEFRGALLEDPAAPKPYSSFFEIKDMGANILLYNGRGFGHGIGLSQWGAQGLALTGKTYTQILSFYYPGAGLKQAW